MTAVPSPSAQYFTTAELDLHMAENDIPVTTTRVFLLGNTGVGKSFLCNAITQRPCFESATRSTSVTGQAECELYDDGLGQQFVLYNVPGLREADASKLKRNCAEVERAFQHHASAPTVAVFIFGNEGGRLRAEDIQSWRDMCRYAPELAGSCVTFVINKVDMEAIAEDGGFSNYKAELTRAVRKVTERSEARVAFLPHLAVAARKELESPAVQQIRSQLIDVIAVAEATVIRLADGAKIELDEARRARELKQLREDMEKVQAASAADRKAQSEAHQADLAKMQKEHDEQQQRSAAASKREMEALQVQLQNSSGANEVVVRRLEALEKFVKQAAEEFVAQRRADADDRRRREDSDAANRNLLQGLLVQAISHQQPAGGYMMMQAPPQFNPWEGAMMMGGPYEGMISGRGHASGARAAGPAASAPLSWNAFRSSVAGKGYTREKISSMYRDQKKRC